MRFSAVADGAERRAGRPLVAGGARCVAPAVLPQHPLALLHRHGPGEQEALPEPAPHRGQHVPLRRDLDALRDHLQPERVGDADDALDQGDLPGVARDVVDVRLVDLQYVDGEVPQIAQ